MVGTKVSAADLHAIEVEKDAVNSYVREASIEDTVHDMVEGLLKDRPSNPKAYLLSLLSDKPKEAEAEKEKDNTSGIVEVPGHHLIRLFEVTRNITAEIVPAETINIIIRETIKLLNCDRCSLFVYDKRINMLVLNASNLQHPIRVSPGQGISGAVFNTQETVNIPECYEDSRFDSGFDKVTGYRTKSLLTMAITDFEGASMGVLQAINKADFGEFNQIDELLLGHLTQHVGIALRNAEVYKDAIVQSERANGLLHMIQSLSQDLGTQSLVLTITMHANELVQADRCTVFLVDEGKGQLWSVSTDDGKEIRIPKTAGIAGQCCNSCEIINIPEAYEDSRFNQEIDKKTGYRTKSILAVPVLNENAHGKCLAVIQMINKTEFDGETGVFDDDDVQVMETFAKFVGGKLNTSSTLMQSKKGVGSEGETAFGEHLSFDEKKEQEDEVQGSSSKSMKLHKSRKSHSDAIIEEEDEEPEQ